MCPVELARRVLGVLFVLAVPLFLVTAPVTWAVNDLRLYSYGFRAYNIPAVTGMSDTQLMQVAREIRKYFNSGTEPLSVRARVNGIERDLFNAREVAHMRDVKHLIWGVYAVLGASLLVMLLYATMSVKGAGGGSKRELARATLWGSGLTLLFLLVVGGASLINFNAVFLVFHQISFANDFWQLDCPPDMLICMFPEGFWADATLMVGLATVVGAFVLAVTSGVALFLARGSGGGGGGAPTPRRRTARRRRPSARARSRE